jgi:hypothetical protein
VYIKNEPVKGRLPQQGERRCGFRLPKPLAPMPRAVLDRAANPRPVVPIRPLTKMTRDCPRMFRNPGCDWTSREPVYDNSVFLIS